MTTGFRDQGPAPKRSDERVRRNEPAIEVQKVNVAELIQKEVTRPAPNEEWHPIARNLYDGLLESAQCVFYERSDWDIAHLACENISRELRPQVIAYDELEHKVVKAVKPIRGASLSAYSKIFTNLLMTEVDRRRAGIEIERAVQLADLQNDDADVINVDFQTARSRSIGN